MPNEQKPTLKNITINLPGPYVDALELLVERKIYASRSAIIREAIARFLKREELFLDRIGARVRQE